MHIDTEEFGSFCSFLSFLLSSVDSNVDKRDLNCVLQSHAQIRYLLCPRGTVGLEDCGEMEMECFDGEI